MEDKSHCPDTLHTKLSAAQEMIVVELRRTLWLPTDDLLAIVTEFINPAVSRSGLGHCLRRHSVSNLKALLPQKPELFVKRVYNWAGLDI